ncbi:MAG: TIGR04283 family arsenosugar biosynthesis glycosyltransferase [Coriobacteriia bacterium]|nr:TIGR04283 family arsenosugar biosynthesis glycosyltransferase [Coriobacteriia bacterium]
MRPRLIVLTRYPVLGTVKSRIAAELGAEAALALHRELAEHALRRARAVELAGAVDMEIRLADGSAADGRRWLGHRLRVRPQREGTLGDRLAEALGTAISEGAPAAIAIGADCPDVGGSIIREAIAHLDRAPVALGPAEDGGYYLVGVRADVSEAVTAALFEQIPWGTSEVLAVTLARLSAREISPVLLPTLADIDRPEDSRRWEARRSEDGSRVSVVVPALDEESTVASAVLSARVAGAYEVIVADGGSTDATVALAEDAGALVVHAPRGRAVQMNAGAAIATGDTLLFLHADTVLPPDACAQAARVLDDSRAVGGAFGYSAGSETDRLDRFISAMGQLRYAIFRLPYGDQAIFARRSVLEDLGGFPELPVMEDREFALRLKRLGGLGRAPGAVRTSARAWRERGLIGATARDMATIAGYRLGIDPARLARWRSGR